MLPLEYLVKENLLPFITMERSLEFHTALAIAEPISITRGKSCAEQFRPGLPQPNTMAKGMNYPDWLRLTTVHTQRWWWNQFHTQQIVGRKSCRKQLEHSYQEHLTSQSHPWEFILRDIFLKQKINKNRTKFRCFRRLYGEKQAAFHSTP